MPELSVAVFATDNDQRAVLQVLVDGTSVARTVCGKRHHAPRPQRPRHSQDRGFAPDVILVDIAKTASPPRCGPWNDSSGNSRSGRLRRRPMTQPQLIVSAMRAGVREYIERPTTTTDLLEAFVRLTSTAASPAVKIRAARCSRL